MNKYQQKADETQNEKGKKGEGKNKRALAKSHKSPTIHSIHSILTGTMSNGKIMEF